MLFILSLWPPGGQGGGPPRQNGEKLVLQTQKHFSPDMLYVDNFIGEEYKFMSLSRIAPLEFRGGRGGGGKQEEKHIFIFFFRTIGHISIKLDGDDF